MVYDNTEEVVSDDNRYVKVATGMVVARDLQSLNEYKKKKEVVDKEKGVINNIRQDVDGLKNDISDIKMLLTKLIEDKN